jgi:hypothetical protein
MDIYKPKKEILDLPDHVLELWFGKSCLPFIKELRRITSVRQFDNYIAFIIGEESIIEYSIENKTLYLSKYRVNPSINIEFLKNIFNFEIICIDTFLFRSRYILNSYYV